MKEKQYCQECKKTTPHIEVVGDGKQKQLVCKNCLDMASGIHDNLIDHVPMQKLQPVCS